VMRIKSAALFISGREHNLAVEGLDGPTGSNEARGQMIEQFGMGRRFAEGAKVTRGPHQSLAEMVLPDAIDQDPSREGVVLAGNRVSQLEPAASLGKGLVFAAEDAKKAMRD